MSLLGEKRQKKKYLQCDHDYGYTYRNFVEKTQRREPGPPAADEALETGGLPSLSVI
jgi:hypothetical protein